MTMPPPLPAVTSYGHVVNDTAMAFSQARAAFLPPAATSLVSSSVATQPIRRAADPPPLLTSSGETFTIIRVAAAMQYGDHAYALSTRGPGAPAMPVEGSGADQDG